MVGSYMKNMWIEIAYGKEAIWEHVRVLGTVD